MEKKDKVKTIKLDDGLLEIKQVCDEMQLFKKKSPFFFLVGAGISYPSAPLASEIITHCKEHALKYNRELEIDNSTIQDAYSDWFELAYPNRYQRQNYIKSTLHNRPINLANIKLAHLLSQKVVSNLVITTNFDDFLSRSLNMFGIQHIVSDHPHTVEKINPENNEIQIVHIHGTYWFYDCCNLRGEIIERAERQLNTNRTMSFFIDSLLYRRVPIVIGYSGWENDVFMQALKRRLESPLPFNLYWFCYAENSIDSLPDWLRFNSDVKFVVSNNSNEIINQENLDRILLGINNSEKNNGFLDAKEVFEQFIKKFNIESPEITRDPIGFYVKSLNSSVDSDNLTENEEGKYFFKEVIERLERARKSKEYTTNLFLEELKELLKKSQYEEVINKVQKNYSYSMFNFQEHKELLNVILSASDEITEDNLGYDLMIKISMELITRGKGEDLIWIKTIMCKALIGKGEFLQKKSLFEEALQVYGELIANFNEEQFIHYVVGAIFSKGLIYGKQGKLKDEIEVYNIIIEKYSNTRKANVKRIVARSYLKKAMIKEGDQISESYEVLDSFYNVFYSDSDPEIQHLICLSLYMKSIFLNSEKSFERELEVYTKIMDLFGESEEFKIKELVAKSLKNKGDTLGELERYNEALDTYDEITKRYTDDEESSLKEFAASAMLSKGRYLNNLGNHSEAIIMYDKIQKNYSELEQLSDTAQLKKADTYVEMELFNQANMIYDEIISSIKKLDNSNIDLFAKSYLGKVFVLQKTEQYEAAISVINTLIEKIQKLKDIKAKRYVAAALTYKALNFSSLEMYSDAFDIYKAIITKFKNFGRDKFLNEVVQDSLLKKSTLLGRLGNYSKSVKELDSLYTKLKDETDIDLRIIALYALLNKSQGLYNLGKYKDSIKALEVVEETLYTHSGVDDESLTYLIKVEKSKNLRGMGYLKEAFNIFLDIKDLIENLDEEILEGILGEINSIGMDAYSSKQYELSKDAFLLAFSHGESISGSNLSFMARRGEVTGDDLPSHEALLEAALEENNPFAIVNKILIIIKETDSEVLSEELLKLLKRINDFDGIIDWWNQLANDDDPEGHLVIGLLTRANLISDPSSMSTQERFNKVRAHGWNLPSWLEN